MELLIPRSDIYSVGAMMVEMVMGERPRDLLVRNYTNETYLLPEKISPRLRKVID